MAKLSREHAERHAFELSRCLKMYEALFVSKCSLNYARANHVWFTHSRAGCAACYVGETTQHFRTRAREDLETDRASHILKHLESSKACRSACSLDNFAR